MKYLYIILVIVLASSVLTFYTLVPGKKLVTDDIGMTINGHQLTNKLIQKEMHADQFNPGNTEELLDSFITRELLIQEAQDQAIDKDPGFRKALKTFYEQSLIKVLMDRKYQTLNVKTTEQDIDTYLANYGKQITFTRFPVTDSSPKKILDDQGKQATAPFDDLAEPLKLLLSSMTIGETKIQISTSYSQQAIRLDKIEPSDSSTPVSISRKIVAQMILEFKKEEQITQWINDLRAKASIQIHNKKRQP